MHFGGGKMRGSMGAATGPKNPTGQRS